MIKMTTISSYQAFLVPAQTPAPAIPEVALIEKPTQDKPALMIALDSLSYAISAAAVATESTDDLSPLYLLQQAIQDLTTLEKFAKQTLSTALDVRAKMNAWTDGIYEIKETYSSRKVNAELFQEKYSDQYNSLLLSEIEKFQKNFKPNVTTTKTVLNSRQQTEVFYQEINGYEIEMMKAPLIDAMREEAKGRAKISQEEARA
jgi:hypothetical protein